MEDPYFEIESSTLFSESIIWQLNRDFYQEKGISAWSDDIVPHHLTSNARVGKTYAELIFGCLKDLAQKGKTDEVVYILELGAGHGRLAFHILKHLDDLVAMQAHKIPPYCYVLSDIVEENLLFFQHHPQFQSYLESGMLDVAHFDAVNSETLYLRHAQEKIIADGLSQPIVAIANYFFDSIPSDLFHIHQGEATACSIAIGSKVDTAEMKTDAVIENMQFSYQKYTQSSSLYQEPLRNEILAYYREQCPSTFLFFPDKAMTCLAHLQALSSAGLVLLTMDKGFHELQNLQNIARPDIVRHGSLSLWVNYHALNAYCEKQGGTSLFPALSNFYLEVGCLQFLVDKEPYHFIDAAYQQFVNEFGPDDFNSMKRLAYANMASMGLKDLLAFYRLSYYDSTFFIKLLPRLKHVCKTVTVAERRRLGETLHRVWQFYFNIEEAFDLAYEIGGILYDLAFYTEALDYFQSSTASHGPNADVYYNQALCYYQLREDDKFFKTLNEGKKMFPSFELFKQLDKLEMG